MCPGLVAAANEDALRARHALKCLAHAASISYARGIPFWAGDEKEVAHDRSLVQPLSIGDELVFVCGRVGHDDVEFTAPCLLEDLSRPAHRWLDVVVGHALKGTHDLVQQPRVLDAGGGAEDQLIVIATART